MDFFINFAASSLGIFVVMYLPTRWGRWLRWTKARYRRFRHRRGHQFGIIDRSEGFVTRYCRGCGAHVREPMEEK